MAGNLFMQMFGPMRHVNPRASGMIVFGGGGGGGPSLGEIKQAVQEYADPEFRQVFNNQGNIQGDIRDLSYDAQSGFRDLDSAIEDVYQGMTSGFSSADQRFSGLSDDLSDAQRNITGAMGDLGDDISDQFRDSRDFVGSEFDNQRDFVAGEFDQANENMSQGFRDTRADVTGARQDILDQMGINRTDLNSFLENRFGSIENMTGGRFSDLDQAIEALQASQNTGFTDLSTNVLGGQQNIQNTLDTTSNNLNTYYEDLAGNQATMGEQLTGLGTNLTSFRDQYDDDVTMAVRSRNDIQEGLQNAVSGIQDTVGAASQQTADQLRNVTERQERTAQETRTDFAQAAREITMGIEGTSDEQIMQQQEFKNKLGDVRTLLTAQGDQLDNTIRDSYMNLANAFDASGSLIASSIDAQGRETKRAIDNNGNLIISQFNDQGQRISQFGYDINQMFSTLDSIYDSTIYRTGMMSPATRPYASTSS